MAKAYFKCECGNSVCVVGHNRKDADRKAAWHESEGHLCDECQAKLRAEESAQAAEDNQAQGLPALTGSDKQVAWAETIRKESLDRLDVLAPMMSLMGSVEDLRSASEDERERIRADLHEILGRHEGFLRTWLYQTSQYLMEALLTEERFAAMVAVFRRQTSARWWIDTRDTRLTVLAETLADEIDAELAARQPIPEAQAEIIREAEAEALLKPATEPQSLQIAEISLVGKDLRVVFPEKREDFRLLMRGMGFRWANRFWLRTLGFTAGDPIDRMSETAHRILALGYMVRLHDDHARANAVSGDFDPEQTRWVVKAVGGAYDGWVKILWPKSDDLYAPAKAILGSRYKDGAVYCPPGSIMEVADFAESYGFTMSETPTRMLAAHKAALAGGVVVTDIKAPPKPITDQGERPHLTALTAGIDADLKDEVTS